MTRRSPRIAAAALVPVLALGLAACGGDGDSDAEDPETVTVTETPGAGSTSDATEGTSDATSGPTTEVTEMTISPTGVIDEAELMEDLEAAVVVTDQYWTDHWKDYFTGKYTAPNIFEGPLGGGLYDGTIPDESPTCYGEPLESGNAFYCPDGDFVAWDITLMELGYELGDAWPYLIIAHEWGHAIQADLSMDLQAQEYELQADCLAGAALYGAAADGNLEFEAGDEKEIVDGLNFIADEAPWGMSGDHGDSFQRIESFNLGRSGGVPECLPGMTS